MDLLLTKLILIKFALSILLGWQEMPWALAVMTISLHLWRKMTLSFLGLWVLCASSGTVTQTVTWKLFWSDFWRGHTDCHLYRSLIPVVHICFLCIEGTVWRSLSTERKLAIVVLSRLTRQLLLPFRPLIPKQQLRGSSGVLRPALLSGSREAHE